MSIHLMDAFDAMVFGGYIDMRTETYILPQWYSELCDENNTGFTSDDYAIFRNDEARYLKVPVIRLVALNALSALRLGATEEQLREWGANKEEYREILYPIQNEDIAQHECSDEELSIVNAINKYMLSIGKYNHYLQVENEVLREIVEKWMKEHNIPISE